MCHRPCSSIGFRALVYGTRGCGFEPPPRALAVLSFFNVQTDSCHTREGRTVLIFPESLALVFLFSIQQPGLVSATPVNRGGGAVGQVSVAQMVEA